MRIVQLSILFCLLTYCKAFGQTNTLHFEMAPFQFSQVQTNYFPSTLNLKSTVFTFDQSSIGTTRSIVFKSPVQYEAFFCKMEVKSANKLGIMIKVHAGDYDAYTSGCNYIYGLK